jgi:hypothetical protein
LLVATVAATLLVCAGVVLAQEQTTPRGGGADRYVVVLNDDVSDPGQAASGMARRYDLQVGFVYRYALEGFSAVIPNDRVAEVRTDGRVDYVERDGTMRAVAQTLPWGINKIDADISSTKAGDGTGAVSNVNAYVIDTGIDKKHADLGVVGHVNFAGGRHRARGGRP